MNDLKEVTDKEILEKHIQEILPFLVDKLYTIGDKKVRLNPLTGYTTSFRNYEVLASIIDPKAKVMEIFKKICIEKCIDRPYPIPNNAIKYEAGYEILTLPAGYTLYKGMPWFYPPEVDTGYRGSGYFADVYVAAYYSLFYNGGGIHTFKTKKELKLLILDNSSNMNKIIKSFIDPFIFGKKETKNTAFYKFMKWIISFKYNMQNTKLEQRVADVADKLKKGILSLSFMDDKKGKQTPPFVYCDVVDYNNDLTFFLREDDIPISILLSYIVGFLGYDGTYTKQRRNPTIPAGIQHLEIIINNYTELLERYSKDQYDWVNWGIDSSYLLPYADFAILTDSLKNDSHKAYKFYKKMLLPSVKSSPTYDYGLLRTNNFVSINSHFGRREAMKQAIELISKFKLKFLCLNGIERDALMELIKQVDDAKLYTSVTDFEIKDTYIGLYTVVISTKPLDILEKELLPEPKLSRSRYYIHFRHPDTKNTYIATELAMFGSIGNTHFFCDKNREVRIQQLMAIKAKNPDIILGNMNISVHNIPDYKALTGIMYATNSSEIDYTNPNETQTEFIMTKLPLILTNCDAINYKYSMYRVVLGKI